MSQNIPIVFRGKLSLVDVKLYKNGGKIVNLHYKNNHIPISFEVDRDRIYSELLEHFFNHKIRDVSKYGDYDHELSDASISLIFMKVLIDMSKFLDTLINKLGSRKIYQYSRWYLKREKNRKNNSYSDFITRKTCECVLECDYFTDKDDSFELIQFE